MSTTEVLIVGAGAFGLSISAHLRALGVEHVIAGRPMDTWRAHVPVGMLMKSEPYGSAIASPQNGYDVPAYCRLRRLDYVKRLGPLTLDRFLDYADWYTEQLVPDVRDITAAHLDAVGGGFRVTFADAEPVTARQVVIATGVLPYAHIPAELSGLPSDLVTHTSDHHHLDQFQGRRVAVVGAGQSAMETAALLHEQGTDVRIIARTPALHFTEPNPAELGPFGHIKRPVTNLCEGWHCAFWYTPAAFRRLPESMRITKARTVLGPSGAWWLRKRVEGVVDALTGHQVRKAVLDGSGVQLLVEGPEQSVLTVDHVIAGTGFRIDIARLPFLPEGLRARITTINGYPEVSRAGESSVPGLYFAGAPTAVSIGPSARFIAGTHTISAKLARAVARRSKAAPGRAAA
jgi:cation diffusion facilitator CzcD-associated flavoprotein CzcO